MDQPSEHPQGLNDTHQSSRYPQDLDDTQQLNEQPQVLNDTQQSTEYSHEIIETQCSEEQQDPQSFQVPGEEHANDTPNEKENKNSGVSFGDKIAKMIFYTLYIIFCLKMIVTGILFLISFAIAMYEREKNKNLLPVVVLCFLFIEIILFILVRLCKKKIQSHDSTN